ncbi:MAG: MFS transporter [Bryobacteraceae bacterium]|nr:MFS transporter [Bryobacteraceae bacterium]
MHRWLPTVTMMLVSTISYIDRNTLALLIPTIQTETGLTAQQYGFVVSAFSFAYMAGNPLWGWAIDRMGLRRGMTLAVGLWSFASAAHAWASGFASFAALRFALGFGEGATFPGALRTVVQTLPPESRGRGVALSYSGGSLGAIVTPILMTPIAASLGWRGAFLVTGAIGGAWLLGWCLLSRRRDIREPSPVAESRTEIHYRDARLWAFLASYAMGAVPLGFVLYFASLYLRFRFGLSQVEIGALLWIPPLGWECGYFFWGWVCDRLGSRSVAPVLLVSMLLSLPLAAAASIHSLPPLMAELFLAMFVTSGFIIPSVHYATRIFSTAQTSLLAGLGAGSFSALTALLSPWFGSLFDAGRHATAFAIAAAFPVAGTVLWLSLTASRKSSAATTTNPQAEIAPPR